MYPPNNHESAEVVETSWLDSSIRLQRERIEQILLQPLGELSLQCAGHWHQLMRLEADLQGYLRQNTQHRCRQLYVLDLQGQLYSSSISDSRIDASSIGEDMSRRPYLELIQQQFDGVLPENRVFISDVYIDRKTHKPCLTALHSIRQQGQPLGYLAADFGLSDLPLSTTHYQPQTHWRQIKGDPSIRSTLFYQTRVDSEMDQHLDDVLDMIESLMTEQGIFHAKLHFSSSRATLWPYHDPYHYRLHVLQEIISPDTCLAYARTAYPEQAVVPASKIAAVLQLFRKLRQADDTIYLRAGSLNIMNGLVGLNFSCDGSHYIPYDEFLSKDFAFWAGETGN